MGSAGSMPRAPCIAPQHMHAGSGSQRQRSTPGAAAAAAACSARPDMQPALALDQASFAPPFPDAAAPAAHPPARQKRPHDGDGGGGERAVRPRNDAWQPAIVSSGLFEEYYQGQDICPPEVRRAAVPC